MYLLFVLETLSDTEKGGGVDCYCFDMQYDRDSIDIKRNLPFLA